ncbi:sulfurtransferase complex subunit TusC [Buchnera aphidicola]|uniref:Sulfurtransferase complex subunit TusC n=1 Tax=Buchnera aphidicola (Anoecia oenotherae) TaxID=1241833 RepID=A0A4D6XZT5_9GAMM|nr:sulfurtransferase complex subunit TusC [Buchnera aphidicola]QCI19530.1 sulfurtransferase complex subunit TusC [Buchnera aphidicola (Anoecia oenotherae)]
MNNIAFVFSHLPYGTSNGQEGLNAALALSSFTNKIGLFFINDGVLQLSKQQNSKNIFFYKYTHAFRIFSIYCEKKCYLHLESVNKRGIFFFDDFLVNIEVLNTLSFKKKLNSFNCIVNF